MVEVTAGGYRYPAQCGYCGMYHGPLCPRVKSIEYHPNGAIARVVFRDEPMTISGATIPYPAPPEGA